MQPEEQKTVILTIHNITEQAFHTTDKQTNKHMITQDDICTNKKFTLGGLKG